jgi:hypothetical protein
MGEKRYLDDAAVKILEKHKRRLSREWEATDSDVLRELDARVEELQALLREREKLRRLSVG